MPLPYDEVGPLALCFWVVGPSMCASQYMHAQAEAFSTG